MTCLDLLQNPIRVFSGSCRIWVAYLEFCSIRSLAYLEFCSIRSLAYLEFCSIRSLAYLEFCSIRSLAYLEFCSIRSLAYLEFCSIRSLAYLEFCNIRLLAYLEFTTSDQCPSGSISNIKEYIVTQPHRPPGSHHCAAAAQKRVPPG